MEQEIDQLEGHYIVRGVGRVGRQVVENLQLRQTTVVMVEPEDAAFGEGEAELPRIRGDATDDQALSLADEITRQARLQRCGRCVE
jgi:voltage-gated potassium channel